MNENEHDFIRKDEIANMLWQDKNIGLKQVSVSKLKLDIIEKKVKQNPWIVKADAYLDNKKDLHIDITQRIPVARLFHVNGSSSYLDKELNVLPLSNNYAYAAPVFTNVPFLGKDSLSNNLKHQIAALSLHIVADSFWNAQITQIDVQPNHTFVLIPLLGKQRIVFGDTSRMEEKLKNLMGFYQSVSKKIGWDKYDVLDLRFSNQVVATPAIGYIPPKIVDTISFDANVITTTNKADSVIKPKSGAASAVVSASNSNSTNTKAKEEKDKKVEAKPKENKKSETIKPATKPAAKQTSVTQKENKSK